MGRWSNKYVIGLTGNIATGKSVVRQMLQHLGAYTIDADGLSNQAMQPGAPAYRPVVQKFGAFILDDEKRINRKALGQLVFSNPAALEQLESIVHPIVRKAVDTLVKRSKQRVVVIEAIKLTEGELGEWVDAVWVVDASPKTQLTRLMTKRKLSEDEANMRMKAQNPQSDKLAVADVVIKTTATWRTPGSKCKRLGRTSRKRLSPVTRHSRRNPETARRAKAVIIAEDGENSPECDPTRRPTSGRSRRPTRRSSRRRAGCANSHNRRR